MQKRKPLKYILVLLLVAVVGYNSVYFKKLDEVKASASSGQFNAVAYAGKFWNNKLMPNLNKAIEINQLVLLLQNNKDSAFQQYSHALGIGNIRYFLVKGEGIITEVNENDVTVEVKNDAGHHTVHIATEYIFGNAVRDALGLLDINEFKNTMDFNNVSAQINKKIRTEVLPPFKAVANKGSTVQFTGAIELNREHLNTNTIELIPVALKTMQN